MSESRASGLSSVASFDRVADLYQQARPTYPEALIDQIIHYGRLTGESPLLEIGAGTGKATLPLAKRGFCITGLEPGPKLAEIARQRLAAFARVTSTFEQWSAAPKDASYPAIQQAYAEHASSLVGPMPAHSWYASPSSPILADLQDSPHFDEVRNETFSWQQSSPTAEYCDLLRTYSSHSTLAEEQQTALLSAIARAIESHGGSVSIRYCTGLYLARAV